MTADWQHGYSLEQLRPYAAVFKAAYKPYTFGAFGLPKERDVADALAKGELLWSRAGAEVAAVAIVHRLRTPSVHSDFAQRAVRIPAGDVMVSHLAALPAEQGALIHVLAGLIERARGSRLWVEGHVENPSLRETIEALGFRLVLAKVMASSDLRGLWVRGDLPTLDPLDPADELTLACVEPDYLSVGEMLAVREELRAAESEHPPWAQHYSSYNKGHSWTAFALQGYQRDDPGFIIKPAEMSQAWKAEHPDLMRAWPGPTVLAPYFPRTLEVVARLGERWDRVRFMRLRANGGELTRHADITDRQAGTAGGQVSRFHIPIVSTSGVEFRAWDAQGHRHQETLHEGSLYYLDQRKPHAVVNHGTADRIHLVMDIIMDPPLRHWLGARGRDAA